MKDDHSSTFDKFLSPHATPREPVSGPLGEFCRQVQTFNERQDADIRRLRAMSPEMGYQFEFNEYNAEPGNKTISARDPDRVEMKGHPVS